MGEKPPELGLAAESLMRRRWAEQVNGPIKETVYVKHRERIQCREEVGGVRTHVCADICNCA